MSLRNGSQRWGGAAALRPPVWAAAALLIPILVLAAGACFGGGEEGFLGEETPTPFFRPTGSPSPFGTPAATTRPLATATPAATASPATTPSANVTPVTPFEIEINGEKIVDGEKLTALRIRKAPCIAETESCATLAQMYLGDKKCVTGEAVGDSVEQGNNKWYALKDGGFVYSGFVIKGGACP